MIIGAALVVILGLNELGGVSELTTVVPESFFTMWKPATDPDFPWTGILFGAPILGVWYWCTDQFIVQRVLSAKDLSNARRGTLFGGFLKLMPLFLFVFPGIICYALAQKGALTLESNDLALPALISHVLPHGIKGLLFASLLAALMSSLSSVFNSCSTLITYDFYKKIKPQASERQLVLVGQISTVILVACGIAWIPIMKYVSGELYKYLQSVQAYISPPIAAVFLLGIIL
jgi:SSS family solute:Na+ symporter